MTEARGMWEGLMDFSFGTYATPRMLTAGSCWKSSPRFSAWPKQSPRIAPRLRETDVNEIRRLFSSRDGDYYRKQFAEIVDWA